MKTSITVFFLFLAFLTNAQIKALIWDNEIGHGNQVATDFETEYGCTGCTIVQLGTEADVNNDLANNPSIVAIIRSTSGYENYTGFGKAQWNEDRFFCMPYGSNSFVRGSDIPSGKIIITGAGATENETTFGSQLDFWEQPLGAISNVSSFSNPVIAAKLVKIKETANVSVDLALKAAKLSADEEIARSDEQGYGRINVNRAIALLSETRITHRSFAQNTHLVFDREFNENRQEYQFINPSTSPYKIEIKNGVVKVDMSSSPSPRTVIIDAAVYDEGDIVKLAIYKGSANVSLQSLNGNLIRWFNGSSFLTSTLYAGIPMGTDNTITLTLVSDGTDLHIIEEN